MVPKWKKALDCAGEAVLARSQAGVGDGLGDAERLRGLEADGVSSDHVGGFEESGFESGLESGMQVAQHGRKPDPFGVMHGSAGEDPACEGAREIADEPVFEYAGGAFGGRIGFDAVFENDSDVFFFRN